MTTNDQRFACGLTDDQRQAGAACQWDTEDGHDCLACTAAGYRRTLDADGCVCDARGQHRFSCAAQGRTIAAPVDAIVAQLTAERDEWRRRYERGCICRARLVDPRERNNSNG